MIIAGFAVRAGLLEVVKASLTGSILGNLLFVGGLSMLVGGWKRDTQKFNRLAVEASAGQMVVATAALLLPALFFAPGAARAIPISCTRCPSGQRSCSDHLCVRTAVHVPHHRHLLRGEPHASAGGDGAVVDEAGRDDPRGRQCGDGRRRGRPRRRGRGSRPAVGAE
jgi:Ca2+:H+ antiporter